MNPSNRREFLRSLGLITVGGLTSATLLESCMPFIRTFVASAALLASACTFAAPVASYNFNNSFASSVAGAPALTVTDPLGLSGFREEPNTVSTPNPLRPSGSVTVSAGAPATDEANELLKL